MVVGERKARAKPVASLLAKQRRLISVDEYERMGEAGIFAEDERLELVDGEIVRMAPISIKHFAAVSWLNFQLITALGSSAYVCVQQPIRLSDLSEPEPDIAILPFDDHFYRSRLPVAKDALLLIEVAHTSLPFDQRVKIPLYAREGIQEVWIVDLTGERVLVHRKPLAGRYEQVQSFARDATVTPAAFPDLKLSVQAILG